MRCERKKDRVEVNPELLAAASAQAEISFPLFTFREFGVVWIESRVLLGLFAC
jgi:BRCA1/BRCA2-containing complex subunit 3